MATRVEEAYLERDEAIDAKGNVTEVEILPCLVFDHEPVEDWTVDDGETTWKGDTFYSFEAPLTSPGREVL